MNTQEILDDLNFNKIRKVMEALNWTWEGKKRSPTELELRECAKYCLDNVIKKDYVSYGTGGFEAYRRGKITGVRFVVDDVNNEMMLWINKDAENSDSETQL